MMHEHWMSRALMLAEKGRLGVSPNPMVGACVVQGRRLVGEGWHRIFGQAHAEAEALRRAGRQARGATLYVTLEPCSSWGKTPPCVLSIVRAGIRTVVIAMADPNPENHHKGIRFLRNRGIRVITGILKKEAESLNRAFIHWIRTGRPRVTLKMAQSLDGKIATSHGESRWISSLPARGYVQKLRASSDAVLVGTETVLQDNPELIVHSGSRAENKPWRVILDRKIRIPVSSKVFRRGPLTLCAVSERVLSSRKNVSKISGKGRILLPVREKSGRLDLRDLLDQLGAMGVASLLVEGGGETAWSFLNDGLVQKVIWILAPKLIGGRSSKTSLEGRGIAKLTQAIPVQNMKVSRLGPDWLMEGDL